jgi:NADH:ubiquinone oxidoreductase subunit 5 (subunit L)/multisubunit Na+/H+ antiporter MnhA subunit
LFKGFIFITYSLVILYSDDYIPGDLCVFRSIMLVFIFVVSMKFLNFSPIVVSELLSWDGLGFVSCYLVLYYQNVRSSGISMVTVFSNRIGGRLLGFCVPRWSLVK